MLFLQSRDILRRGVEVSVIVACRTADSAIVMGADRQLTSVDETREMTKLMTYSFPGGRALIGIAASDVNLAFERKFDLIRVLRTLRMGDDPVDRVLSRLSVPDSAPSEDGVKILCALSSETLEPPKLLGISETKATDLDDAPCCGIGSGTGAAISLLKQLKSHQGKLEHVQVGVCASIWMAKQSDPLCGGPTDVWWLGPGLRSGKADDQEVRVWDAYFESSLPALLRDWIAATPELPLAAQYPLSPLAHLP